MPAFGFSPPRFSLFHRSRRSDSRKPSSDALDDATASHSSHLSPSPALSSRPLSLHGAQERAVDVATRTSRSPAPSNLTLPQNSPGALSTQIRLGDASGQPSQVSLPAPPINAVESSSALKLSPRDSVAQPPVRLLHHRESVDSVRSLQPPLPQRSSDSLPAPPPQSLVLERQYSSGEELSQPRGSNQGMFSYAHEFTINNAILINDPNYDSLNFMDKLLKETIPGAAANSSARHPPPRCHPGTSMAILERCLHFIAHCNGVEKMRWVVGAAGVGKSAVMQSVADSPQLVVSSNASVFLSINGRDDGSKVIITFSHQLAAKSMAYRRVIEDQAIDNPYLLQSSMPVQFENFIVQPFIYSPDLNSAGRVLIVIDGLDECSDTRTQVELLKLISDFCISYPSSPIVWLIASRPEPHITSFFSRPEVIPTYEKEEIVVDSDEARADVERFLRHELAEIGIRSDFLGPQWLNEQHLRKLARTADGLFAYAHTVIKYIGDSNRGDPVLQLSDVLNVIDELPLSDVPPEKHPMAPLDALYARILSKIPPKIMVDVRKLLLLLASDWDLALSKPTSGKNFIVVCNWLGMTADEAYAALNRLRSILDFPPRHEAHRRAVKPFHKSLIDYLYRSTYFPDIKLEAQQIKTQCAFRILKEASSSVGLGDVDYEFDYDELARNEGTSDRISITWRADEGFDWDDDKTRLSMYKLAIAEVAGGVKRGGPESSVPERQHSSDGNLTIGKGFFHKMQRVTISGGTFIDISNYNSLNFMEKLLNETIPGAAANSSARHPPPQCHPGTSLTILERCLYFIVHCNGVKKMRWVVGAAGVGKSAVMQNVADSPQLEVASNACVFFSINGRQDGSKAIITLSYQFAAKSDLYRCVIEDQVADNPQLLQSSMPVQFENFIVQPFIHSPDLNSAGRVLVIIDGLDECSDTPTQVELLQLISNFCFSYPSSPIVWLIASRPEPHITSFFSRPEIIPTYEKEEIVVDSDEARADVERFLRHELTEVGMMSNFLGLQWPDELHMRKLAQAADGLFAYAHTVTEYIGDLTIRDPVSQLSNVLNVIDELPLSDLPREQYPMALLDALYARILSSVPPRIMINVRKLLLLLASDWDLALSKSRYGNNLIVMCNWLGMTADEAYAALTRLRSILYLPERYQAHCKAPKLFHKSLINYISRSTSSSDIKFEAQQIKSRCTFRVLNEAPCGTDFGDVDYEFYHGELTRYDGTRSKISVTWRAEGGIDWDDDRTRLSMYKLAIGEVVAGMKQGDPEFQSEFCIKLLTTRLREYHPSIPYFELSDFVFDKSRCHEFMTSGVLKQVPAKAIFVSNLIIALGVKLQFHRPVTTTTLPDPWNSSCRHERVGQWEQGKEQDWITIFDPDRCSFCFERLKRQFQSWITRLPDHAISMMFTSTSESCVELRFVDPEDDVSAWTCWFWLFLSEGERKELGSTI